MHKLIEALEEKNDDFTNMNLDDIVLYFTYNDIKDKSIQELIAEANHLSIIVLANLPTQFNKISDAQGIHNMESNVEGFV